MTDICKRCNEESDELRTIAMACCYAMDELKLPFERGTLGEYLLTVCKRCRSDWLHFVKMWFHIQLPKDGEVGSGIFIRDYGYNREVSEEKFREMHPDVEPVRFKGYD